MSPEDDGARESETIMTTQLEESTERSALIAALEALTGRLNAPDLTLSESKVLRTRLAELLERVQTAPRREVSAPPRPWTAPRTLSGGRGRAARSIAGRLSLRPLNEGR